MIRDRRLPTLSNRQLIAALTLIGLLVAGQPLSSQQGLSLSILSDDRPSSELLIGDDLQVDLIGAVAGAAYELELLDEQGVSVVAVDLLADLGGTVRRQLLWPRSGVVGCDVGSDPDPAAWRFHHFAEAEERLAGQVFTVIVNDAQSGAQLLSVSLPLVDAGTSRYFFSDAAGCWRGELYTDEALFLSGHDLVGGEQPRLVFLVPDAASWHPDAPLAEVRETYQNGPQEIRVVLDQSSFATELWSAGSVQAGNYVGVIRWSDLEQPMLLSGDTVMSTDSGPPHSSPGGVVIRPSDDRLSEPTWH